MTATKRAAAALSACVLLTTGCASKAVGQTGYVRADVDFMRNMIVHHAQALELTKLVPTRTTREDIGLLAERIEVSQVSEVEMMRNWLTKRGQAVTDSSAHHDHGTMPGMLSTEDVAKLANTTGTDFDRLFLELMIRHHEGALIMLEQLHAAPGAAEDVEIFQIASHIDADQRAEIARMRRMLTALLPRGSE
jgi:uncharacterized protein (DUF305 family)